MPQAAAVTARDDEEALYASLEDDTEIGAQEWRDCLSRPETERAELLDDWRTLGRLGWARIPGRLARVTTVLTAIASLATPVTAIAGGATGIAGVIKALGG